MYACSPRWEEDWISEEDAEAILSQLSAKARGRHLDQDKIDLNYGIHLTGGEPFLNFDLLLSITEMASRLGIPPAFVETNCFWSRDDEITREKLARLKQAGLRGILISANPFTIEQIPFERIERAAKISEEVFGGNVIVYQSYFYNQFKRMGINSTLPFEEYLQKAGYGLRYIELLPLGRVSYKLADLYRKHPPEHFSGASCEHELIRDWHIHIDNYCNFIPGYCAGISLGDARDLDAICRGIDLDELPVLRALVTSMEELYRLGKKFGYEEEEGYISRCHLCVSIRRRLAKHGQFRELRPKEFYEHLGD